MLESRKGKRAEREESVGRRERDLPHSVISEHFAVRRRMICCSAATFASYSRTESMQSLI